MRRCPVLIMVERLDDGGCERDAAKIAVGLDQNQFEPHLAWARRIAAAETSSCRPIVGPKHPAMADPAARREIATVSRSRAFSANRTDGLCPTWTTKAESVGVALNPIQNQNVRAGKKGLRMARGASLPKAKHSWYHVFYAGLHQNCGRAHSWVAPNDLVRFKPCTQALPFGT